MKKSLKNSAAFIDTNKAAAQKAEKQERVFQTIQAGAGELAIAAETARTQCLEAIMDRFDAGLETLDKPALIDLFAAMETGAPKSVAKRIAMHPTRPEEVQEIVEEAEAKAKARKQEERRLQQIEALRKRLAAREEDERKLAELEADAAGGQVATGNTPEPKTAPGKSVGKSGDTAEA